MRIVTWNVSRRTPDSTEAQAVLKRVRAEQPDVVCLTEAREGFLSDWADGDALSDAGARSKGDAETERMVILWSRRPWSNRTPIPELSALGGAVSAVTETPIGPVRVIGICAPYHLVWPERSLERPPAWSQNIAYLQTLGLALKASGKDLPTVVAGKFNQFVPLSSGSWAAHHALNSAMSGFSIVTRGDLAPIGEQSLDHVAVSSRPRLRALSVRALDRLDAAGRPLTDHFGVVIELEGGAVQMFD
ncbi:MAG: endonuclease/exonuclease/phosphatase family protein [Alphaproteobacteria bacterium]|nr:endonuclease/exonuclease/phosphatase family protein [Alphaproteobacteria bacterium]